MSKRKKIIYTIISLIALFMTTIYVAYAEELSELDKKINNIDRYQSYMENEDLASVGKIVNPIVNFLFDIAKLLYQLTDFVVKVFYQGGFLDSISSEIGNLSVTIYNNLFGKLGMLLFLLTIVIIAFRYLLAKGGGIKDLINVVLVIGVATLWTTNSSLLISGAGAISSEIGGLIATSSKDFNKEKKDATYNSKDAMREEMFDKMIEKPFLLLNWNSTSIEDIGKERVDNLLKEYKTPRELLDYLEKEELNGDPDYGDKPDQNLYVSDADDSLKLKFGISFFYIVINLIYSIPYWIISFFSFVLDIQIILYIIIFPIMLVASIFSVTSIAYMDTVKKLIGLYIGKAMLGLVVLFISLSTYATNILIGKNTAPHLVTELISAIIALIFMYVIWKKRNSLGRSFDNITGAKIRGVGNRLGDKVGDGAEYVKDKIKEKFSKDEDEETTETEESQETIQVSPRNNINEEFSATRSNQKAVSKDRVKQAILQQERNKNKPYLERKYDEAVDLDNMDSFNPNWKTYNLVMDEYLEEKKKENLELEKQYFNNLSDEPEIEQTDYVEKTEKVEQPTYTKQPYRRKQYRTDKYRQNYNNYNKKLVVETSDFMQKNLEELIEKGENQTKNYEETINNTNFEEYLKEKGID